MKKSLYFLGILAALLTAFTACTYRDYQYNGAHNHTPYTTASHDLPPIVSDTSHDPISYWQGLYMYVAAGSVTPSGLRLSIVNNSADLEFGYGVPFTIEQYLNGIWRQVPFIGDIFWPQPLLIIFPDSIIDENINWKHMHGQLPPGQYRVVKNFMGMNVSDPTPMWEQNIQETYLYATFTIEEHWQAAHDIWQSQQNDIAAQAYARFAGLDLEILEHSARGLSFTLTNNNPYYTYIIDGVFVGWEDTFPEGGSAAAMEYSILSPGWPNPSWPFEEDKQLQPGQSLSLDVDWYYERGNLDSRWRGEDSPNPNIFDLTVMVRLDVDEEYIQEHFRHMIPGLPNVGHRITVHFEVYH